MSWQLYQTYEGSTDQKPQVVSTHTTRRKALLSMHKTVDANKSKNDSFFSSPSWSWVTHDLKITFSCCGWRTYIELMEIHLNTEGVTKSVLNLEEDINTEYLNDQEKK